MKKFLKIVGVVVVVIITTFAILAFLMFNSISDTNEKAIPFIEESMPLVTTWNMDNFGELLTPETLQNLRSERGQKVITSLSRIGDLKSFKKPTFVKSTSSANSEGTGGKTAIYTVEAEFENGQGLFTFTLLESESGYLIHGIHLNSDFFMEQ
ncbi:hypothetical protein [Marinomonas balearica]|uniref:DUF4019 domain-containing protein n=1 Tax=Marinomonas balearica TaxID=491947 RepID=A0A4R6M4F7_9GAMM|nr:hypothetical protein [Marinomonas balearica]TDO96188.1 hypothetical protein DFP79_2760 [Marinomonas balearica]